MRMLILLLMPVTVFAICPADLDGTQPTDKWVEYGLVPTQPCADCREINKFPQDMANAAWNYIMVGAAAAVYDKYYGKGTLSTQLGPESKFNVRVRNSLGQAVTVTIVTEFNTLEGSALNITLRKRTSIKGWRLQIVLTSGIAKTYPYEWREGLESEKFLIPSTTADDGYTPGEDCLDNDGTRRSRTGTSPGTSTTLPTCGTNCGGPSK